jgi:hypothetical protein
MPRVGFEPTISVSERAKTVHALVPAATVNHMKHKYTLWAKCRVSDDKRVLHVITHRV